MGIAYIICTVLSFFIINQIKRKDENLSMEVHSYPFTPYYYATRLRWYRVLIIFSFIPYFNLIFTVIMLILFGYLVAFEKFIKENE
jgi:hypothetical protein